MATTLQDRLKKLGLRSIQHASSTPQSSHVVPKWQQELDQYRQHQRAIDGQQHQLENKRDSGPPSPKSLTVNKSNSGRRVAATQQASSIAYRQTNSESSGDEIVFLPRGRPKANSGKTTHGAGEDECEPEEEPMSSTTELIGAFCLFSQVMKLPYKYLKDPTNNVSGQFFSQGKAFERGWQLYHITAPDDLGSKPIFLVPHEQVENLISEINAALKTSIRVPPYPFTLNFYKDGMPEPAYQGIVNSKNDFDGFKSSVPDPPPNYMEISAGAITRQRDDYESWREKIERALEAESKKKSTFKQKKRENRIKIAVKFGDQLKRVQRYFGLRPPLPDATVLQPGAGVTDKQLKAVQKCGHQRDVLNTDKAAEYPFEDQTVILGVDVESWEEYHAMITEIGVSTLDTAEIVNIPPGHQGENWIQHIRSRHFRIRGRENIRNMKYCIGDPERFDFGQSEFVDINEAPSVVDSCFEWPFSAQCASNGKAVCDDERETGAAQPRNLLLVGHDILGDVEYLTQLGSEIFSMNTASSSHPHQEGPPSRRQRVLSAIRERLDTAILHQALTGDENTRSLTKICYDLDITAWQPHNAGNDARYTLEAFVKLAIKARQQDDTAVAQAKEQDGQDAHTDIRQLESELNLQAEVEAERDAIEVELRGW